MQEEHESNWLDSLDGRTSVASELQKRHKEFCEDLGGYSSLSYSQRSLVSRALFLEYHLQEQECLMVTGGDFDSKKWISACGCLHRILNTLGLSKCREYFTI